MASVELPTKMILSVILLGIVGCTAEQEATKTEEKPVVSKTAEKGDAVGKKPAPAKPKKAEKKVPDAEVPASAQSETPSDTEQSGDARVTPDNPEAVLSSIDTLMPDTIQAARINRNETNIPYTGVWASNAKGCAQIDQDVYDGFAVITLETVRTFEEVCEISAETPQSNPVTLDASCSAEGETNPSRLIIEMVNGQNIKLKHEGTAGFELTRCQLPPG